MITDRIGRHKVLLPINHKNYNFREKKSSQVLKERENLHRNTDKGDVNVLRSPRLLLAIGPQKHNSKCNLSVGGNPAMDWHFIQGEVEFLVASCSATETGISSGLMGHLARKQIFFQDGTFETKVIWVNKECLSLCLSYYLIP